MTPRSWVGSTKSRSRILFTADGKKGSVQANAIQSGVANRSVGTFATLKAKLGRAGVLLDYGGMPWIKPRAPGVHRLRQEQQAAETAVSKPRVG